MLLKPILNDVGQELHSLYKRCPPWLQKVISSIIILVVVGSYFLLLVNQWKEFKLPNNEINNFGKILGVSTDKCEVDFCSSFIDDNWEGLDNFNKLDSENFILTPIVNEVFSDRTLYFKDEISPNYTIRFRVLPLNEERINLFIRYGNFRCLIGNGDYKQLACEENIKYPNKPEYWEPVKEVVGSKIQRWIGGYYGIKPKKELDIRIESKTLYETDQILVKLSIAYFPNQPNVNNIGKDNFEYYFTLPYKSESFMSKFGIGLIDPERSGDISAEFIDFQLDKDKI